MSSINSLINPPDESEQTHSSPAAASAPATEASMEASSEPIKQEEPEESETAAPIAEEASSPQKNGSPTVSQETILKSFDKIKTHFPAARIKKIMQSDEDIGKVAQATPVVVGRALEIFMANLVEAAIIEAKDAGVRRIAASHVRAAVEETEQFDFLVDVVSKYPSLRH